MAKIFDSTQENFLTLFGKNSSSSNFYLSGGTALCEFYIPYRFSEDLDFFSEKEFEIESIIIWLKSIQGDLKYKNIDIQKSFNRNLIFLEFSSHTLKTEFTYYPFQRLEKRENHYGVQIDSIIDIAVNKLFTIYQKPRSRDFTDLYSIKQKYSFTIENLIMKAKFKFDWHVDPLTLGARFLEITQLKDYPQFIGVFNKEKCEKYFIYEAKKLKKEILS